MTNKKRQSHQPILNFGFENSNIRIAAVIVAHPDDETLWAGGTILMHSAIKWKIITLCRKSDFDRTPRFTKALERFNATGVMGDLDDGPDQAPLSRQKTEKTLLLLLPPGVVFDLVITHSPWGEYTRHRRHEETSRAVQSLWLAGQLKARSLWMFAYEDGNKSYLPKAIETAHLRTLLPQEILKEKYRIITEIYGFLPQSYEARTTPKEEAFWCFNTKDDLTQWLDRGGTKI
ncbi:MAG: PIG-L family deacetylase [Spirochaetota bacterium]|nr:MAG: PIG-L family deacetylase [Spirochaetota bacterium]